MKRRKLEGLLISALEKKVDNEKVFIEAINNLNNKLKSVEHLLINLMNITTKQQDNTSNTTGSRPKFTDEVKPTSHCKTR